MAYGLTLSIGTHDPARIATHERLDLTTDVASARTWRERWSFLLRRPGWAPARARDTAAGSAPGGLAGAGP